MMKKYILLAFVILLILPCSLEAQYSVDDYYEAVDTIVDCKGYKVRVQTLNYSTFKAMEEKYGDTSKPSVAINDLEEVIKILGSSYKMQYRRVEYTYDNITGYDYIVAYVERKGVYRQMLYEENEGFQAYYPQEKIFLYFGGHSSDQAFFIDTGEPAYNPNYSAVQKDGKYRLTGLHDGQEGIYGEIQKKNGKNGKYSHLFYIYELSRLLNPTLWFHEFWTVQFWHNNTLYMCVGYGNYANKEKEEWDRNNTFIAISLPD